MAQVTEKKTEKKSKRLEDVPIVRDVPKVFPEDLPGLSPTRQIHEAQVEAFEKEKVKDENLHGDLDNSTSKVLIALDSWKSGLLVYKLPLSVVPMAQHGSRHLHLCQQILDMFKDEGRFPETSGSLVQPEIPRWKWDDIGIDFITRLPETTSSYDTP
ncbi:hypothetical protein Tco_0953685 [Tanacetum coccineum]|uniref:Uncharacterized protein n=1 Tax=Tanacetum coccineum TaxID=301880 RepID=A0ABQ5E0L6_9ASTR